MSSLERRRWLSLVAACAGLWVVLYLLAVHTRTGQRLDEAAVVHHRYDRTSDSDARFLTHSMALFLGAVAVVVALYVGPRWFQLASRVVAVAAAVLGAGVLRKNVLTRPSLTFDSLYGQSYPSGHAAAAMGLALTMVLVSRSHPVATRVAAMTLVGVINGLIVFIPMHRPSDVIGGDLLALAMFGVVALVLPILTAQLGSSAGFGSTEVGPDLGANSSQLGRVIAAALALAGAGIGASALLGRRSGLTLGQFGPGFPVAQAMVVFVGAAIVGVVSLLVRPMPEVTS